YIDLVKENGMIIVDNLDFHGMIFDIDNIKNRNTKQLVKKIKRFKDWIFNHDEYNVEYYQIGDGICIITRKDK
ncbi:MAG: O-methyltransferase, partial [Coprobacillus sp.]